MEQVVKEISHLFQFFPDEVTPLEYPSQIDLTDAGGNYLYRYKYSITFIDCCKLSL